jgi:Na+/melibiose symporter-like transporter
MSETLSTGQELPSLPMWKKIMFALGQLGWSLASFGVGSLVMYFYAPPVVNGQQVFPTVIFPGLIFGVLTVIGLINMIARAFDAVTNPVIATWSDTNKSKFGRRRLFMAISAVPFALFSVLVFIPLQTPAIAPTAVADSWLNIVWLCGTILVFYFFFVMYATPYTALLSELGHNPKERLFLSTIISVTWALGFIAGNMVYTLKDTFINTGMSAMSAFQTVLGIYAIASAVLMLLPVIFINERKYASSHVSNEGVLKALGSTLKNKHFSTYISSEVFYFICLNIMQMGMVYFVTALLNLEDSVVSGLMTVMFLLSFVYYPFVNILGNKLGKKRLLIVAFVIFSLDFLLCAFMGILAIPATVYAYVVVIIGAMPIAIFGILPNAVVADIAEADGISTGNFKAGIFFGVRTFEMNIGISIANALFPSLLTLGKTYQNPTGVRAAAIAAAVLCSIGLLIFSRYREKEVVAVLARKEKI